MSPARRGDLLSHGQSSNTNTRLQLNGKGGACPIIIDVGAARAIRPGQLVISRRIPDIDPRIERGEATLRNSNGSRQRIVFQSFSQTLLDVMQLKRGEEEDPTEHVDLVRTRFSRL